MKMKDFQIVKKNEGFSLQAIIPPSYGYQDLCSGRAFYRERGSNLLVFESKRKYSLFALGNDWLVTGPADVVDYFCNPQFFVYQKKQCGDWYEQRFEHNDEKCLGDCPGNFFVLVPQTENCQHIFMYDERGNRRRFECQDWERMDYYNVFLLKNGLYEIYSADTGLPAKIEKRDIFTEDIEGNKVHFLWRENKQAYQRAED